MVRCFCELHDIAVAAAVEPSASQQAEAEALCDELRQLFCNDVDCFAYDLDVRVFGSVSNNTHLGGSDADIAVIPKGCRLDVCPGKGPRSNVVCDPLEFRRILLGYLKKHYGEQICCDQRRAILLCGGAGRRQADIVVLIPRLWQYDVCFRCGKPKCSHGYELRSTCERQVPIATWPEQHRDNALVFDRQTNGIYKRAVRAAKALLRSGFNRFPEIAPCLPPVLIENLFARVPVGVYRAAGPCPYEVVKAALRSVSQQLGSGNAQGFRELSGMRNLFAPEQTWTIAQARANIDVMRRIVDR